MRRQRRTSEARSRLFRKARWRLSESSGEPGFPTELSKLYWWARKSGKILEIRAYYAGNIDGKRRSRNEVGIGAREKESRKLSWNWEEATPLL